MASQYLRNLGLWARGIRWLWTRGMTGLRPADPRVPVNDFIFYKPGWGPWRFLLGPYLTTYLACVLIGGPVVSISRMAEGTKVGAAIDWFFEKVLRQGPRHCANTGPVLWGSRSVWE